jgi:hypothetical protein
MGIHAIREFATDRRLLEIAGAALATTPTPFRATLFDKSSDANWLVVWHQDTALPLHRRIDARDWGPWSVKAGVVYAHAPAGALSNVVALRVHLDDSTSTNGPLRVLPRTHRLGLLSDPASCPTFAGDRRGRMFIDGRRGRGDAPASGSRVFEGARPSATPGAAYRVRDAGGACCRHRARCCLTGVAPGGCWRDHEQPRVNARTLCGEVEGSPVPLDAALDREDGAAPSSPLSGASSEGRNTSGTMRKPRSRLVMTDCFVFAAVA